MTLKLVLKKKWWDMVASGQKREEYREATAYWSHRFYDEWCCWKPYDEVTFYLGYAKDRPSMTFRIIDILEGPGRPEWGAEPGKEYFVIQLGKRIN